MAKNVKNFLVSTADFALYYNDVLACTGTTNLNTSIEVSMQEQNVNAGKGNQLLYSFKYGRELSATLQAADWKLEYIAANVGSKISEELTDVYKMGECVTLTEGIGVLSTRPIGDVAIETPDGRLITVKPTETTVDLSKYGLSNESVSATYQYSRIAKVITIDSDSSPNVFKLVLEADKHNNSLGKVGSIQITIPSYQPSGNFTMSFTPDGVSSTDINGKALAVSGDRCSDGSAVYAYVKEFDDTVSALTVTEIAATPTVSDIAVDGTSEITVIGLKGALYSPIELTNEECQFVSDTPSVATVSETGLITGISSGTAKITVSYGDYTDEFTVTVK